MPFAVRTFPTTFLRALALLLAVALIGGVAVRAGAAPSAEDVQDAKDRAAQLEQDVKDAQARLAEIRSELAEAAAAVDRQQGVVERIRADLLEVRERLNAALHRYERITDRLDERAAEAFMGGPASDLAFLLGSSSMAELSDRIEFVDAVAQSDAELSTEVANLRNQLDADRRRLEQLEEKETAILAEAQAQQERISDLFAEQTSLTDLISRKAAEAEQVAKKLSEQRQEYLKRLAAQATAPGPAPTTGAVPAEYRGVLEVCPVPGSAFGDGFGAPRYGGGYHPHAGNDMLAPYGTPILAPFSGTARTSFNSLGGNSVYVYGSKGYVYNAHLQSYSDNSNGSVQAGDVIGYVGDTGDATGTPHDHFEFHPNTIPSGWPVSAYGYSVIGSAVNPYPLLVEACY